MVLKVMVRQFVKCWSNTTSWHNSITATLFVWSHLWCRKVWAKFLCNECLLDLCSRCWHEITEAFYVRLWLAATHMMHLPVYNTYTVVVCCIVMWNRLTCCWVLMAYSNWPTLVAVLFCQTIAKHCKVRQ